ncbi:hypothetical protein HOD88_00460 [archaeon]|jgi:hypothetical protein|nr:hypothetical protein [archaeon]
MDNEEFLNGLNGRELSSLDDVKLEDIAKNGVRAEDRLMAIKILGRNLQWNATFLRKIAGDSGDPSASDLAKKLLEENEVREFDPEVIFGITEMIYASKNEGQNSTFIYLPDSGIKISSHPFLSNYSWEESIEKLHDKGFFMPNISQFREFQKVSKFGKDSTYYSGPLRKDFPRIWLNARARRVGRDLFFGSKNFCVGATSFSGPDFKAPKKSGTSFVSFAEWVRNNNPSGLPRDAKEVGGSAGSMRYVPFQEGVVATFYEDAARFNLDCASSPLHVSNHVTYACKMD